MKLLVFLFCLMALSVGGCSWIPRAGPSTSDVLEQGQAGGEILFDVVPVDDRVVNTLIAQPKEKFTLRFKKDAQPREVGDRAACPRVAAAAEWTAGRIREPAPAH